MSAGDAPWELEDDPVAGSGGASRGEDARPRTILEGLTEAQAEAVRHTEGPLLILAAAGSGKTRVVTRRIAWLIAHGVPPWSILALTFTNKAAGEMKHRAESLLSSLNLSARGLTVTTFHTLCARLLRRYATEVPISAGWQGPSGGTGLSPQFTIYDSDDQMAAVKKALNELELSTTNWPPRSVLSAISNAKNDLQSASDYAASAKDFYTKNIARAYSLYERDLRRAGAVDFDDLLLLTARLLEHRPEVRRQCVDRWQYLMIDEYQDTNRAQFQIASMLAGVGMEGHGEGGRANVCVVGDPDQAIYGWRGADISNILDFEKSFAGCRVIMLGENFRSTAPILGAADALIQKNKKRKHKPLFTKRSGGKKVQMVLTRDEHHEAQLVADWFQAMRSGEAWDESTQSPRPNWRDMAVFYRTNALSRVVEDAMRRAQIPYVVARGTSFFQREEIKNALGYLRVVANEADDVSLARIINTPTRGIGDKAQTALEAHAAANGQPLMQSLRQASRIAELSSIARGSVQKFLETLDGWTGNGTFMGEASGGAGGAGGGGGGSLRELVERIVRESGLEKFYRDRAKAAKSDADEERLDNLSELVSSAAEFELEYDISADPANAASETAPPPLLAMLRAYLESVALVSDADRVDPEQGAVTLMTLHASKGLEFAAVAVIGLEEGTLPHSRANESDASLEEERRLCFVGMTRAMRQLLLSCARYRTNRGIPERTVPSRFLSELSKEHVAVSDQAGEDWNGGSDRGGVRYEHDDFDQTVAEPRRAADAAGWRGGGGEGPFKVGTRVRHPQFGLGEVLSITGGLNARAQIRFRDAGVKTLLLQYARLTPVK